MAIEVDSKVTGKVSGITHFGAFVDLGDNKTGLVHISEVSDRYVKDINEELKIGQEILVKVLTIGSDGKIGLSIRKAVDKPAESPSSAPRSRPSSRPTGSSSSSGSYRPARRPASSSSSSSNKQDFDSLMSSFLKDSEDRLTSIKRNTESKRGGRGGRRT